MTDRSLYPAHTVEPGADDFSWVLVWDWRLSDDAAASRAQLTVALSVTPGDPHHRARTRADLTVWVDDQARSAGFDLADADLTDDLDDELARAIFAALGPLSAQAMSASEGED